MWRATAGHKVSVADSDDSDDWDTEADYENKVNEKELQSAARTHGDKVKGTTVKGTAQSHEQVKIVHNSQRDHSVGFGGKYGVQKDRKDSSAEDYNYTGKTAKHQSATDYSKGFGGRFGVDKDRKGD